MENHSYELSVLQQTESVAGEELNILSETKSKEPSIEDSTCNLKSDLVTAESSDDRDDERPVMRRKRVQRFSDSDSESDMIPDDRLMVHARVPTDNEDSNDAGEFKRLPQKSRIRLASIDTDSDSDNESDNTIPLKNVEQQSRLINKRNKMCQKFKSLVTLRVKELKFLKANDNEIKSEVLESHAEEQLDMSEDEALSIDRIRQKMEEKTMHLKSTIYDPDTSEEDGSPPKEIQKLKRPGKSTKLTSPKPVRMSAKQALENMQKIKSESNRMLREKDISLPYHRPKALSLKDIMSRRRPAVSSDGKALPIKMNEDQLKQYVLLLEQRQKEIMELCKSDTEEEEEDTPEIPNKDKTTEDISSNNDTIYDDLVSATAEETKLDNSIDTISNQIKISVDNTAVNSNSFNKEVSINDKLLDNISNGEDTAANDSTNKFTIMENMPIAEDLLTNVMGNTSTADPSMNTFEANTSTEIELVYNDSVEDSNNNATDGNGRNSQVVAKNVLKNSELQNSKAGIETNRQNISLHYDSEKKEKLDNITNELLHTSSSICSKEIEKEANIEEAFSDDDINMEDIDKLIENADVLNQTQCDNLNSPMLISDSQPFKRTPKLTGAPGMIIDLDGTDPFAINKLTGVELLKERFAYFAKLKTPEEMEREREKRIKPGLQHSKLKHELEEKMAEQRSFEWAKRLQEEKQQQIEIHSIRGDASDAEEDIEKIEAKLGENEDVHRESTSESEEEEEEEELSEVKDKPIIRNPMIADEAEDSDCDEFEGREPNDEDENIDDDENDGNIDNCEESDEESSEDEGSEEEQAKPNKKGRILKAFEDSDDEDIAIKLNNEEPTVHSDKTTINTEMTSNIVENHAPSPVVKGTQDDELQLAQMHKSFSEDLFTSQESDLLSNTKEKLSNMSDDKDLGTQTFSILNSETTKQGVALHFAYPDNLSVNRDTQPYDGGSLDHVVGMCSGSFSQNLVTSQYPTTQNSQSLDIGEDVLALCTGKFYDNQFVSQLDNGNVSNKISQQLIIDFHNDNGDKLLEQELQSSNGDGKDNRIDEKDALDEKNKQIAEDIIQNDDDDIDNKIAQQPSTHVPQLSTKVDAGLKTYEKNLLTSILDELNDPEFESPKPNKYFVGDDDHKKENLNVSNGQVKKKFIIDSDDEGKDDEGTGKKNKFKKKKLRDRALHISDDEDDQCDQDEEDDELSEIDDNTERIVEYDSEENEVIQEIQPEIRKKKRKVADFFEQEAELTSEDEWAGSGDEDEVGLDRMEREAGDDDTFHQGRLQRELEQIHMRDVLDQDKREVRIIQELLFEDGDLGGGSRQRKFRWNNEDGVEETDAGHEIPDTQEEEFESEEQWRKQRHERVMFLKQMQKQDETEDSLSTSVNRTTIIKANLCSKTMSSLLLEVNASTTDKTEIPASEKKNTKDIPSPEKSFKMFQQNCHGSLLTRGSGMLARLAALATPLTADDDAPKVGSLATSSKRNFVFATLTQEEDKPKLTKRKADSNAGTPKLLKKMKTEEKQNYPKSSLLDHIRMQL